MTPELWEQVEAALSRISETAPESRGAVLETLPPEVRSEVELLLPHYAEAESNSGIVIDQLGTAEEIVSALVAGLHTFVTDEVLLNRFEIKEFLGSGGMGEVYRAVDRKMGDIAIKTVRLDLAESPIILERFRTEVQRARLVSHQNVCRVHELFDVPGIVEQPLPFLTMELLTGETLYDLVKSKGPLPETEARRIGEQICEGLRAAHRVAVVHRDLKSGNVILAAESGGSRRAVITDFGLARLMTSSGESQPGIGGAIVGTPAYLAPELFEGAHSSFATDVFALGVVLFRMSTGQYPFDPDAPLEIALEERRQAKEVRTIQPDLSQEWNDIVAACLAFESGQRPGTADLSAMLAGRLPAPPAKPKKNLLSRRNVTGGAALVVCGAVGARFWQQWTSDPWRGAAGPLRALLEEFETPDTDASLGRSVRNLLRITLAGSKRIQLLKADEIRSALDNLGTGAVPVKGQTAQAIARHQRAPILIGGEIRLVQDGYSLQMRITAADSGKVVRHAAMSVPERGDLPAALDQLAARLQLTDAASAAQVGDTPLQQADTDKPDALEPFTVGLGYYYDGQFQVALEYLQQATRADPNFGIAWVYQAVIQMALRRVDLSTHSVMKAWDLRDKLNARHKHHAEALYYIVHGDYERTHEKFRLLAGLYPNEAQLQRHLAQSYALMLKPAQAVEHSRRALELDPQSAINHNFYIGALADNSRWEDSEAACRKAEAQFPNSPMIRHARGYMYMMRSEIDQALRCSEQVAQHGDFEVTGRSQIIKVLLLGGRIEEARRTIEIELPKRIHYGDIPTEMLLRYWLGQALIVNEQPAAALGEARILAARPDMPDSLFALQGAAEIAWRTGAPDVLATCVIKCARISRMYSSTRSKGILHQVEGLQAALKGAADGAIAALKKAHAMWPDISISSSLAELLMKSRQFDEALVLWMKVVNAKSTALRFEGVVLWVQSLACAAGTLEALGHSEQAAAYRSEYHRHWGKTNTPHSLTAFQRPG